MKLGIFIISLVAVGILALSQNVISSKILVLSFVSTKSHKITYMPLIEELAKRGHEITIVTPINDPKEKKNIRQVFTVDLEEVFKKRHFNAFDAKETGKSANPFVLLNEFMDVCKMTYDLPRVKDLLMKDFDLVFLQPLFNDCVLGMVYRLKAPLVLFFPTSVPDVIAKKIGTHFPPSFVSNFILGYGDEMNFYQRFLNFGISHFIDIVWSIYYEPNMAAIYRDKLGADIPSPNVILGNASLILSNGHFSLSKPKPYLPDIIDVGGLHSLPPKPLPKDLEDFVTKGNDGFIFFSMGSAIQGSQMSEEKRKMILNVFSKLKQQVLWKWETERMPDLPENVKLSKWLPQQDILGHPQIRMFITHCGGGGLEESIYHGVPLLGLPMMGDQIMNAKNAKKQGFLVDLEWTTLTEEKLLEGINEILENPIYHENVKKLSGIFKDQIEHPLQRGVFWIEYVLRHKGAPQLKSAARNLNYFQYHSWDVIAAYLTIIFIIIKVLCFVVKFIGRKVCRFGKSSFKKMTPSKKNQ